MGYSIQQLLTPRASQDGDGAVQQSERCTAVRKCTDELCAGPVVDAKRIGQARASDYAGETRARLTSEREQDGAAGKACLRLWLNLYEPTCVKGCELIDRRMLRRRP